MINLYYLGNLNTNYIWLHDPLTQFAKTWDWFNTMEVRQYAGGTTRKAWWRHDNRHGRQHERGMGGGTVKERPKGMKLFCSFIFSYPWRGVVGRVFFTNWDWQSQVKVNENFICDWQSLTKSKCPYPQLKVIR